jgi:hypothetical protein
MSEPRGGGPRPGSRRLAMLVAGVAVLAAPPSAAVAADPHQCGPDDRWCVGALVKQGTRFLEISGFDLRGEYRVCVRSPGARRERCRTFALRPGGAGAYGSSVAFARNFPHARHGTYRVRWVYRGEQLGRTLAFRA